MPLPKWHSKGSNQDLDFQGFKLVFRLANYPKYRKVKKIDFFLALIYTEGLVKEAKKWKKKNV